MLIMQPLHQNVVSFDLKIPLYSSLTSPSALRVNIIIESAKSPFVVHVIVQTFVPWCIIHCMDLMKAAVHAHWTFCLKYKLIQLTYFESEVAATSKKVPHSYPAILGGHLSHFHS